MNTYYYTITEKKDLQLVIDFLSINFDFDKCIANPVRKYGAQSFVTYSSNNTNIIRISKGNFYTVQNKELYCSEVCYYVNDEYYVVRNGIVVLVKKSDVLKNEPA